MSNLLTPAIKPTTKPSTRSKPTLSMGAIIGIAVGGAAALILAVVLVVCLCMKKKKDKEINELPPGTSGQHQHGYAPSYVSSPNAVPQEMSTANYAAIGMTEWKAGKTMGVTEAGSTPVSELPAHMSPAPENRQEYYSGSTAYSPPPTRSPGSGLYGPSPLAAGIAYASGERRESDATRSTRGLSPPLHASSRSYQGTTPPIPSGSVSPHYPAPSPPEGYVEYGEYHHQANQQPLQQPFYQQPQNAGSQRFYQNQPQNPVTPAASPPSGHRGYDERDPHAYAQPIPQSLIPQSQQHIYYPPPEDPRQGYKSSRG